MDRFQKFSVYLLIILSITVAFNAYYTHALSAPSRNSACVPGSCGSEPCDIRIYIDTNQYGAANCRNGDNYGFNTAQDLGALFANQVAPNCPTNGCKIFMETGSFVATTTPITLKDGYDVYGTFGQTVITATPTVTRGTSADSLFYTTGTVNSLSIHDLSLVSGYYAAGQWSTNNPQPTASVCCSYGILTTGGTVHSNLLIYHMVITDFGNGFYLSNSATTTGVATNWNVHDLQIYQTNDCGDVKSQNKLTSGITLNNINCYSFSDGIFDFVATDSGNSQIPGEMSGIDISNINGINGVTGGIAIESLATVSTNGFIHGVTISNVNIMYNRTFTSTGRLGIYFNNNAADVADFTVRNIVITNGDTLIELKNVGTAAVVHGSISGVTGNKCYGKCIFINSSPISGWVAFSDTILDINQVANSQGQGIYLQANTNNVNAIGFYNIQIIGSATGAAWIYETQSGGFTVTATFVSFEASGSYSSNTGNMTLVGTNTFLGGGAIARRTVAGQTVTTTVVTWNPPSNGIFVVTEYLTVTAYTSGTINIVISWVDESGASRAQTYSLSGTGTTPISPITITDKAGNIISVTTTGTFSLTYDAGATIQQYN